MDLESSAIVSRSVEFDINTAILNWLLLEVFPNYNSWSYE